MKAPPFVRVAVIEVDPAQRDAFVAAVTDEMDAAVRLEPGVLALYAVADRDEPSRCRFFEVYVDEAAYRAHLETPHFRRYRAVTESMIRSRTLIETLPVHLSAKAEAPRWVEPGRGLEPPDQPARRPRRPRT